MLSELEGRAVEAFKGSHPAPENTAEGEAEGQGEAYTRAAQLVRQLLADFKESGD